MSNGTLKKKHKSGGPFGVSILDAKPYKFSQGEKDTLQAIKALDLFTAYQALMEYEQGGDAKLAVNLPKPLENIEEMDTMSVLTHIQNLIDSGDLSIYEARKIIAPGYGLTAGMMAPGEGSPWHTTGKDTLYISKETPPRMKREYGSIKKPDVIMHELGHTQESVEGHPLQHQNKEGAPWHSIITGLYDWL